MHEVGAVLAGFKPRDRAVHVYTEAARVELFKKACEANIEADQKLKRLADLMDESHASCRCAAARLLC